MARRPQISAAILQVLTRGTRHGWTLEDLHASLRATGARADFSTVFRAAEKLATDGKIRKLLLEDGRARFELASGHHDHLLCERCHELVPIPCLIAEGDLAALECATGASITGHHLVLSGLCRECRGMAEAGQGFR